jgi:hypothetical protein
MRSSKLIFWVALTLTLACSPKSSHLYLPPQKTNKPIEDGSAESFDPKVDILFVVDNSGSMDYHQKNLIFNVELFTNVFLTRSILDYNIGVISTDNEGWAKPCCGQLEGNVRVVTKLTPSADSVLKENLALGVSGSGLETIFDPVINALTPPNVTGWNAGFLRPDAALILIFITDAEDQSAVNLPDDAFKKLVGIKNGDPRKLLAYGAIVPSGVLNCMRDEYAEPKRIEKFLSLVSNAPNNILSLCATDYGQRLAEFALQIVDNIGSTIYLRRSPDISSIKVFYGSAELPRDIDRGWSYDPKRNAVILGGAIDWASQPAGSRVKIYYKEAKLK